MRTKLSFLLAIMVIVLGFGAARPSYAAPQSATAGDLRGLLDTQLGEHVLLAASATDAALNGRTDEFKAAAASLDANSVALSKSIGSVYGTDAENAFLPLWRKHIGFFVDYTQAVAAKDAAKKDMATKNLIQYGQDFGAFINSANPNLPKQAVADLLAPHVMTLNAVIDAQAVKDYPTVYTDLRKAYTHMDMVASALAGGIAKQFPDKFTGAADSSASGLRSALTNLLNEHVYLAADATNAALGGRDTEFKAAAAALDGNSVDLSKAIGSVYGTDAENAFLPLWRKHIGFFVDYTQGVATKDQAKKDMATKNLIQYGQDFGAFINSANPNLPKQAVADLLAAHVTTLNAVIDAQGSKDYTGAYTNLRAAYAHMPMVANALTDGIVKQFSTKFTDAGTIMMAMPNTGAESNSGPYILAFATGLLLLVTGMGLRRRFASLK
ncbi:MAG: LPXTG cell wall anchor domain-containing protein [Herpetosiphonaceae bacterium]|nr:LPXTG cell wall anchor domain-containing protein [Herpetosiphonaceae bacterium]